MAKYVFALFCVAASATSLAADDTVPIRHGADPMAAAVRIRITENQQSQVGSGTIIQSQPGYALVLTCAHIMDRAGDDALIEVDVFTNDEGRIFLGKIIGHHIDSDVGLISIRPRTTLPVATVDFSTAGIASGDPVMSIGCNNGARPSRLHVCVRDVNPYQGADNLTCACAPTHGRSGGGLFNQAGRLIGVCSAANRKLDHGLYAGRGAIREMLERHDLTSFVQGPGAGSKVRTASQSDSNPSVQTATGDQAADKAIR
ncbi:MAG: serine protease [Planctomycetaceae bacterium]